MNKFILVIFCMITQSVLAIQYKVLYVSASDILCGSKRVAVSDTISDTANINWGKTANPYMIVKNLETKQQRKLTGSEMKQRNVSAINSFGSWVNSFSSFITVQNQTSTESLPAKLQKLDIQSDTYYLDDVISIETSLPTDGKVRYFKLRSKTKSIRLSVTNGSFIVISKKQLIDNGFISRSQKKVKLCLEYNCPSGSGNLTKDLTFLIVD